jgi:hypothetical protein
LVSRTRLAAQPILPAAPIEVGGMDDGHKEDASVAAQLFKRLAPIDR